MGVPDLSDAAHDEVSRLCKPGERWRMSIPANPKRDSDLIITAALEALQAERDAANARADAAEAKLQEAWEDGYNTALTMVPHDIRVALGAEAQS